LAIALHVHGHHRGTRGDLLGLSLAAIEVGGIEVDIGVAAALQRSSQKGLHLLHALEGLIHPAAGFEDHGQGAAGAQLLLRRSLRLWDLEREIPHLGGESAGPIAVAVAISSSISCCSPRLASSGFSLPALLPSSSEASSGAARCLVGLPTPCKASRLASRLRCAAHPGVVGVGVPGNYTTAGDASLLSCVSFRDSPLFGL
jgi:hypothetical protein